MSVRIALRAVRIAIAAGVGIATLALSHARAEDKLLAETVDFTGTILFLERQRSCAGDRRHPRRRDRGARLRRDRQGKRQGARRRHADAHRLDHQGDSRCHARRAWWPTARSISATRSRTGSAGTSRFRNATARRSGSSTSPPTPPAFPARQRSSPPARASPLPRATRRDYVASLNDRSAALRAGHRHPLLQFRLRPAGAGFGQCRRQALRGAPQRARARSRRAQGHALRSHRGRSAPAPCRAIISTARRFRSWRRRR